MKFTLFLWSRVEGTKVGADKLIIQEVDHMKHTTIGQSFSRNLRFGLQAILLVPLLAVFAGCASGTTTQSDTKKMTAAEHIADRIADRSDARANRTR
jgi:hypothetical protein